MAKFFHGGLHFKLWMADMEIASLAVLAWAVGNFRSSSSPAGQARFVVTYDRQRDKTERGGV